MGLAGSIGPSTRGGTGANGSNRVSTNGTAGNREDQANNKHGQNKCGFMAGVGFSRNRVRLAVPMHSTMPDSMADAFETQLLRRGFVCHSLSAH